MDMYLVSCDETLHCVVAFDWPVAVVVVHSYDFLAGGGSQLPDAIAVVVSIPDVDALHLRRSFVCSTNALTVL